MFTSFHSSHLLRTGVPGIVLFLLLTITSHAQAQTQAQTEMTSDKSYLFADTKWTWAKLESDRGDYKVQYHTAVADCKELSEKNPGGTWTLPTQEQVEIFYRNHILNKNDDQIKEKFPKWKLGEIWLATKPFIKDKDKEKAITADLKKGTLSWGKRGIKESMMVACVTPSKPAPPAPFKPDNNGELKTYVDNNGLSWLKPKDSNYFGNSNSSCQNEAKDKGKTWRLPTVKELMGFYYQVVEYPTNADTLVNKYGWKLGFSWSSEPVGRENVDHPQHYTVKLSPAPNRGMPDGGAIYHTADNGQTASAVCVHD